MDLIVRLHGSLDEMTLRPIGNGLYQEVVGGDFFGLLIYRQRDSQWEFALRSDIPNDKWHPLHLADKQVKLPEVAGST